MNNEKMREKTAVYIDGSNFYGYLKDKENGQQKFFTNLQNDGFIIKRGRIMPIGKTYKEKGTDVKIAVDLKLEPWIIFMTRLLL